MFFIITLIIIMRWTYIKTLILSMAGSKGCNYYCSINLHYHQCGACQTHTHKLTHTHIWWTPIITRRESTHSLELKTDKEKEDSAHKSAIKSYREKRGAGKRGKRSYRQIAANWLCLCSLRDALQSSLISTLHHAIDQQKQHQQMALCWKLLMSASAASAAEAMQ